jgi:hypothetical protein
VLAWSAFLEKPHWRPLLWFVVWSILALLTKGTAIALALVPPISILFGRRWRVLLRPWFWIPTLLVVAVVGPWYFLAPDAQHQSVERFGGLHYIPSRILGTPAVWAGMLGPVMTPICVAGLLMAIAASRRTGSSARWQAALSMLIATWVCRISVGAWGDRHLISVLPVFLLFAAAPIAWFFNVVLLRLSRPVKTILASAATAGIAAANVLTLPPKAEYGYSGAAQYLTTAAPFRDATLLVCSGADGEGMLISEVAMREKRPGHTILRGTKVLAIEDYMGYHYKPRFRMPADALHYLDEAHVGAIILDVQPRTPPHCRQLSDALHGDSGHWSIDSTYGPPSGAQSIQILRRTGPQ